MPVGINQWRAGITGHRTWFMSKVPMGLETPVIEISYCALQYFAYMYLFIYLSVLSLPLSLVVSFFWTHLALVVPATPPKSADVSLIFAKINLHLIVYLWLAFSLFMELTKLRKNILIYSKAYPRNALCSAQHFLFAFLIGTALEIFQIGACSPISQLLLCGDIHPNPGPQINKGLKFFHRNLNSICARD